MAAKTYTTEQGDMWDNIAKKLFNDEAYIKDLMGLNGEHISIIIFPAGVVLKIPEVDETRLDSNSELPPWRAV
jgi:hypothetical protein